MQRCHGIVNGTNSGALVQARNSRHLCPTSLDLELFEHERRFTHVAAVSLPKTKKRKHGEQAKEATANQQNCAL